MKKKIISFALWGKTRAYCIGAVKNAILTNVFFPGWKFRLYYDSTVPEEIIEKIKTIDNTELFFIEDTPTGTYNDNKQFGMFWRFYPLMDDDVEIWLSRDVDSRLSKYEYDEIQKFMHTEHILHSFRYENEPYCRGGLVAFRNFTNGKDNRIVNGQKFDLMGFIEKIDKNNCPMYVDENFLNQQIFPLYSQKYSFSPRKFDCEQPSYVGNYVGMVLSEYDLKLDKNINHTFLRDKDYSDLSEIIDAFKQTTNSN